MGEHDGHRERLRRQFLDHGLEALRDYEVLELLLFYAIPRRDTNPIARKLLQHFGSLAAVLDASPSELQQVFLLPQGSQRQVSLPVPDHRHGHPYPAK